MNHSNPYQLYYKTNIEVSKHNNTPLGSKKLFKLVVEAKFLHKKLALVGTDLSNESFWAWNWSTDFSLLSATFLSSVAKPKGTFSEWVDA